jgi:hypothetical protein
MFLTRKEIATMKQALIRVGTVAVAVGLTASSVNAGVYSETKSAQAAFAGVSAAELPAQAASFVSHQAAKSRSDAAVGAMKAAIARNPSAAAAVLASIVQADPAAAPEVTAAATALLPKQRLELARIAAKSAPAYAAKIAARLAKQDPSDAQLIAQTISDAAPSVPAAVILAAATQGATPLDRVPQSSTETPKSLADAVITTGGAPYNGNQSNANIVSTGTTQENGSTSRTYAH